MTRAFIMQWCCIGMLLVLNGSVQPEFIREGACTVKRTGNKGKEFILAYGFSNFGLYDVKLFVSSTENVSVSVESPFPGFITQHIISNAGTQEVILDKRIVQTENGISSKSIIIRSSSEISVHGLRNPLNYIAEAFTALPIESLSTTYVISLYYPQGPVYISIVSVHEGTSVSITLNISNTLVFEKVSYSNGDTIRVQLEQFQSFMLSHSSDLSGTIVKSNKPISVYSGGDVQIPINTNDEDSILSQLLPVEHWDTKFIVPPLYPRSDSLIRIYAFTPNTCVTIKNATHDETHNLARGMFIEEHLGNGPVVVNSSQPISVVQYAFSESHDSSSHGDPIMMVIPGIHQFSSDYLFPSKINQYPMMKHYVAVIIKNNSLSGLRLDGQLLVEKIFPVDFSEEHYVVVVQELSGYFHKLTYIDQTIKFGALVYGFDQYMGYGFPAGFEFIDIVRCDTTQLPSPTTENNLVCFSCTEMPHLKYCDQLEKCNDDLGCFVERNHIGSHISYNSGCVKSNKESCEENNNNPSRCSRCCKTSLCNSHGCGDDGFESHDSRGPLCFDCQHLSHPSECLNIVQCAHGEFCYIEERLWGDNDKVYSVGCRPKYHCRSASIFLNPDHAIIGRRSVTTCSECCEGDFCNTNCTVLSLSPVIG